MPAAASRAQRARERCAAADDVQAALGRQLGAPLGHQAAIGRAHAAGDLDHLRGGRHLQIHARAEQLAQQPHVALLDVAAILAQVQRDAVGAGLLGHQRRLHRLRIARAALLAQRRDVIDVDAQVDCGCHQPLRSLRG